MDKSKKIPKLLLTKLPNPRKVIVYSMTFLLSGVLNLAIITSPAKADSFYSTGGNVNQCSFASVTGVQYNDIGGGGIEWNANDVEGVSGNWIQTHNILDVADIAYPNAHRYPGTADKVAVPPNTRVEVGLFVWNYTGHNVDVDNVHFFTSRENPAFGDLTRVGAGGDYATTPMNGFEDRSGKRVITGSLGTFNSRVAHDGRIFYTFDTIQPIQFVSFNAEEHLSGGNLTIEYTLTLQNISEYNVGNIRVRDEMPSGQVYDQTFSFNAGQTRTITYSENWGSNFPDDIVNDGATVYDNNRYTEVQAEIYPNLTGGNSGDMRPAVIMRDDSDAPTGWNAGQPTWGQTSRAPITIEVIPYWFNTDSVSVEFEPKIELEKTVSDSDESRTSANNIQGGHLDDSERRMTYYIEVRSTGDIDAEDIEIKDDISEILEFAQITRINNRGTLVNDEITWDIGDLDPGDSETVSFEVQLIRGIADMTRIDNFAEATSSNTPPEEDTTRTTVHSPILQIEKDDGVDRANPSDKLTWTLNVRNIGTGNAYNVEVYDIVPDKMTPENISDNGVFSVNTREIRWSTTAPRYILNGSYDPDPQSNWGREKQLTFDVVLDDVFPIGMSYHENRAIVETDNYPPAETEHTTPVEAIPHLELEKYVINDTAIEEGRSYSGEGVSNEYGADADVIFNNANDVYVRKGDQFRYTLAYRNTGNADVPDTYIRDFLPRYVVYENQTYELIRPEDILDFTDDIQLIETATGYEITWFLDDVQANDKWKVREIIVQINPELPLDLANESISFLIDNNAEIRSDHPLANSDSDNAIVHASVVENLPEDEEITDDDECCDNDINIDIDIDNDNTNNNDNNNTNENTQEQTQDQSQDQQQQEQQQQDNDQEQSNIIYPTTNSNPPVSNGDSSSLAKTGESILPPLLLGIFLVTSGIAGILWKFRKQLSLYISNLSNYVHTNFIYKFNSSLHTHNLLDRY